MLSFFFLSHFFTFLSFPIPCATLTALGDHVGHNYTMNFTGGGVCDCGDEEAWSPKGFCRFHAFNDGDGDGDPLNILGRKNGLAIELTVRVVLKHMIAFVSSVIHSLEPYPTQHHRFASVCKLLVWIRKLFR